MYNCWCHTIHFGEARGGFGENVGPTSEGFYHYVQYQLLIYVRYGKSTNSSTPVYACSYSPP